MATHREFDPVFAGIDLQVVRLDQCDAIGSGNKVFKLRENFIEARAQGYRRLISFGGAHSNHLHALALLGREQGFTTVGVIRGEAPEPLNATLREAQAAGMQLHYVSRADYRRRYDPAWLEQLAQVIGTGYWIPEGGGNLAGVRGCLAIGALVPANAEVIVLPCGTGATLAGVAAACPGQKVLGISVLKGAVDLEQRVIDYHRALQQVGAIGELPTNWQIKHGFHCGGYARVDRALVDFLQRFERDWGIPVEPVYSGKMFYALQQLLVAGEISGGTRVVAIHTGGMQGARGMRARVGKLRAN